MGGEGVGSGGFVRIDRAGLIVGTGGVPASVTCEDATGPLLRAGPGPTLGVGCPLGNESSSIVLVAEEEEGDGRASDALVVGADVAVEPMVDGPDGSAPPRGQRSHVPATATTAAATQRPVWPRFRRSPSWSFSDVALVVRLSP